MSELYYASVTVHVLAAMIWLGGMLFLGLVGAPVLRQIESPALRQKLFQQLGLRARAMGWWSIAVLVVTGTINLWYRGWLQWDGALGAPEFWRTATGRAMAVKIIAVAAMITASATHNFLLGPMAGRATSGSPNALVLRRRAALLARVNALIGVIVVAAAVRLVRGG